jgi:hypothetical protein
MRGRVLGHYRVLDLVEAGGMIAAEHSAFLGPKVERPVPGLSLLCRTFPVRSLEPTLPLRTRSRADAPSHTDKNAGGTSKSHVTVAPETQVEEASR